MRYKHIGAYALVAYLNQATSVVINLVFIRTLSLAILGDIALARVWMQLMDYSHMGLRFALDRYVPVWASGASKNLLWLCVVVSSAVSVVIALLATLFSSDALILSAFLLWGFCASLATILKNFFRAKGETKKMLWIYVLCPTLPAIIQSIVAVLFDFRSFLIITIVLYTVFLFYLFLRPELRGLRATSDMKRTLVGVSGSTASLFVSSIVVFLSFSVDRLLLSYFGSREVLGEYSIVLFAFSLLLTVPSTLAEFVFPNIIRRSVQAGQRFFPIEMLTIALPTMVVLAAAFIIAPYAIALFTEYSGLTSMVQLVLVGVVPYSIIPIVFHTMSALDMRRQLIIAGVTALIIYIVGLLVGSLFGLDFLFFYTIMRVGYGYVLLGCYVVLLSAHKRV